MTFYGGILRTNHYFQINPYLLSIKNIDKSIFKYHPQFCVGNITKSENNCPRRWQWYETSLCLHKTSRFYFMQIWHSCQIDVFFLYYWIKIQYFTFFKQNKVAIIILFYDSRYFRIYAGLHISRDQHRREE
jgi:hypothetical protein